MTVSLEQAYASATQTPFLTVRLMHSALTNGHISFCQYYQDTTCTLEDGSTSVLFEGGGCYIKKPDGKGVDIEIENVSLRAYNEIKAAQAVRRSTGEMIEVQLRMYLPSDLTAPQGQPIVAQVQAVKINAGRVGIRADNQRMQDAVFPYLRVQPNKYLGVKWAV